MIRNRNCNLQFDIMNCEKDYDKDFFELSSLL